MAERNHCPHCATCGHWRADHRNLNNRPRPCHYDDGCRGFKENDESRCEPCAVMTGGVESDTSVNARPDTADNEPLWPESAPR